jgi:UDP-glucoronosyl and UDP-glucosyl transferase
MSGTAPRQAPRRMADIAVTTGPAVDPAVIPAPQNVSVQRWARHADVLPHCSAVVTHGGHVTVLKALAAGVPLVVVPLGRDQPGNAARVVHAGQACGSARTPALRPCKPRSPGSWTITATGAARRMAAILAAERDDGLVADELKRAAADAPAGAPARHEGTTGTNQ